MSHTSPNKPAHGFLQLLWLHKKKAIGLFLAVMALVTAATFLLPRAYRSEAKLLVRLGRENATLDLTAVVGKSPVVAVPPSRENDLNSIVEVIQSKNLIEKVVKYIGAPEILGRADFEPDKKPRTPPNAQQLHNAIRYFSKNLDVQAPKKSNIVTLSLRGYSPKLAQAALSKLVEYFLGAYVDLNRSPKSETFFAEQVARLEKDLAASESELQYLKTSSGFVIFDGQKQIFTEQIMQLGKDHDQVIANLAASEAELTVLRGELKNLSPTTCISLTKGVANQALDQMRNQRYSLQLKQLELLTKFPENHPQVVLLGKQIEKAESLLADEKKSREQTTVGPNELYVKTKLALLTLEPQVVGLRAKRDLLKKQLLQKTSEIKSFDDAQLKIATLNRKIRLQEHHLRTYAESLELAKIDQALRTERISNINVVQPATFDIEPVSPQRKLNLALGFVFAGVGSLSLVWLAERRRKSNEPLPETDGRDRR